jgi:hypothetical protein
VWSCDQLARGWLADDRVLGHLAEREAGVARIGRVPVSAGLEVLVGRLSCTVICVPNLFLTRSLSTQAPCAPATHGSDGRARATVEFSLATEYTPSEKRKVERLHLTCVQTLLCGLPCYTGGRRGADRRLSDGEPPLTLEQFV